MLDRLYPTNPTYAIKRTTATTVDTRPKMPILDATANLFSFFFVPVERSLSSPPPPPADDEIARL